MEDLIITTVLYRWRVDFFLDDERTLERRCRNRSYRVLRSVTISLSKKRLPLKSVRVYALGREDASLSFTLSYDRHGTNRWCWLKLQSKLVGFDEN